MVLKIYFNDKPLFLCDEITEEIKMYMHHDDAVYIDELSTPAINAMIYEMQLEKVHAGVFYFKDMEGLKKAFWKKFMIIQAGGGLVLNNDGEMLLMFRRGKWDLPKGKLDPGESMEECAVREVKEETGIQVKILKKRLVTYHTYKENGKYLLKESHWYDMLAEGTQELVPQTEEEISDLRWVNKGSLKELLKNAYPSVIDVVNAVY